MTKRLLSAEAAQSTARAPRVLLVEDDANARRALEVWLSGRFVTPDCVGSLEALREAVRSDAPDLILLDVRLPDGDAFQFLERAPSALRDRTVLVTAHREVELAVAALRLGVRDYLVKPVDLDRLDELISALPVIAPTPQTRIDGTSTYATQLRRRVSEVAQLDGAVIVRGEFGSGRRRVAEAIHRTSRRGAFPMLRVAAGGLFDGASTEAHLDTLLEATARGSLVLTDVDRLSPADRTSLVAWVSERRGSLDPRVFLICDGGEESSLLAELRGRTDAVDLRTMPLRARLEDMDALVEGCLDELEVRLGRRASLAPGLLARLRGYTWPRGLHDLMDSLESAVARGADPVRWADLDLPEHDCRVAVGRTLAEVEKELILATLDSVGQDKSQAARILGVCRKTIYNRLAAYRAKN